MKRTFQPSNTKRKNKHGFRERMSTKNGQKVLARRRAKGRKRLTVSDEKQLKQFGLSNQERIKSKKDFDSVYSSGEILFSSNQKLKAVFLIERETEQAVLKAAFAVSRKAGIAVWRNRVKRLFRESFRLNKAILTTEVEKKKIRLNIVFSPNSINERRNKKIYLEQIMPDVVDLMNKIKVKLQNESCLYKVGSALPKTYFAIVSAVLPVLSNLF